MRLVRKKKLMTVKLFRGLTMSHFNKKFTTALRRRSKRGVDVIADWPIIRVSELRPLRITLPAE